MRAAIYRMVLYLFNMSHVFKASFLKSSLKLVMGRLLDHSLIRGILTQSCSAGAKNFTKCVFNHVQFSGVIQNIAYHRAIFTLFVYVDYYQNNQFY